MDFDKYFPYIEQSVTRLSLWCRMYYGSVVRTLYVLAPSLVFIFAGPYVSVLEYLVLIILASLRKYSRLLFINLEGVSHTQIRNSGRSSVPYYSRTPVVCMAPYKSLAARCPWEAKKQKPAWK